MTGRPGEKSCCPFGWSITSLIGSESGRLVGWVEQPMVSLHLLPIRWMRAELESPRFMLLSWPLDAGCLLAPCASTWRTRVLMCLFGTVGHRPSVQSYGIVPNRFLSKDVLKISDLTN